MQVRRDALVRSKPRRPARTSGPAASLRQAGRTRILQQPEHNSRPQARPQPFRFSLFALRSSASHHYRTLASRHCRTKPPRCIRAVSVSAGCDPQIGSDPSRVAPPELRDHPRPSTPLRVKPYAIRRESRSEFRLQAALLLLSPLGEGRGGVSIPPSRRPCTFSSPLAPPYHLSSRNNAHHHQTLGRPRDPTDGLRPSWSLALSPSAASPKTRKPWGLWFPTSAPAKTFTPVSTASEACPSPGPSTAPATSAKCTTSAKPSPNSPTASAAASQSRSSASACIRESRRHRSLLRDPTCSRSSVAAAAAWSA